MDEYLNELSLENRIYNRIAIKIEGKPGKWMVWCDPHGYWEPLLQKVATTKGLSLVSVHERTDGDLGSPLIRRQVQERISGKEAFVLHVKASPGQLGWLWGQALRAQEIYKTSLREQLKEWGWRPQVAEISDEKLAQLALVYLQQDPATWVWGAEGLRPDILKLLPLLSEGTFNASEDRLVLDLTIEAAGLPKIDTKNIERWRTYALVHLLATEAHRLAPDLIDDDNVYLIAPDKREFALAVLYFWVDSLSFSKGLPERILEADRILALGSYFQSASLTYGPFTSHAAERAIFAHVCEYLAAKSGRELFEALAELEEPLQLHKQSFWGDVRTHTHAQAIPWDELVRLSGAVKILLAAEPRTPWANYRDVIDWYTSIGWQVENAGDDILRYLSKPTPELLKLIMPLRQAYRNRWEDYMLQWSNLWSQAGCPMPGLSTQGMWLREQFKDSSRPTVVMVIDALRYDIGVALKDELNHRQGIERARISAARTALPTLTALGMGAALPIDERELEAELEDGKWQLYQRGMSANLSIAENRREWLRKQYKVAPDALLSMEAVEKGLIPAPRSRRQLLFIFDDLIDKLGHDENLEALGTRSIKDRYVTTIEHLHDIGWLRVLVITDHGFLHLPDDVEHRVPFPAPEPAFTSRRALAYVAETRLEGPQVLALGEKWRLAFPRGIECFRTYGGLRFLHGGASLQEWIVPCIKIEWPITGRLLDVTIQTQKQLMSLRPKIVLEVRREGLFAGAELLARQVVVRIRDTQRKTNLFYSAPTIITPDSEPVSVQLEPFEGITFERGSELTIEVHDARTDQLIAASTTTLMLMPFEGW